MKKIMCIMLMVGALGMTSCQGKVTEQGGINQGITANSENPQHTKEPIHTEAPGQTEEEKSYYGSWKITSFKMGRVTAISTEEAQALVGTTIIYSKEKLTNKNDTIKNPNYEESTETKETFEEDNRGAVTFEDLGVKANSITAVVIPEVDTIGQAFFVIDDNTIAIYQDGVYFIATKNDLL